MSVLISAFLFQRYLLRRAGRSQEENPFCSACIVGNSHGGEIYENLINSVQPSLANP